MEETAAGDGAMPKKEEKMGENIRSKKLLTEIKWRPWWRVEGISAKEGCR